MKKLFPLLIIAAASCHSEPANSDPERPKKALHIYVNGLEQYVVSDGAGRFAHPVYRIGTGYEFTDQENSMNNNDTIMASSPYPVSTLNTAKQILAGIQRGKARRDSAESEQLKQIHQADSLIKLANQYKLIQ